MTPSNAYNPFPRKVQMEITAQMVQKWIKDEALQDFWTTSPSPIHASCPSI